MATTSEEAIEKTEQEVPEISEPTVAPTEAPQDESETKSETEPPERSQEIPALLESDAPQEEQEETILQEQDDPDETARDLQVQEEAADTTGCSTPPVGDQMAEMFAPVQYLESPETARELEAIRSELKTVLETVHTFQDSSEQILAKVDSIAAESASVSGKINEIALNHELISSELESLVSGAGSRNVLSKAFMVCICTVMVALAGFQIYTFMSLVQTDNLYTASGTKLVENLNGLNKKMAEYNANLSKAVAAPDPHATTPAQHAAAPEASGHEAAPQHSAEAPAAMPLSEKLNRLRNGAVEKKLVRKETGDWFVYTKKIDECIADVEIISALNQAYKRLGRPLPTSEKMPSHNSLCILKPDGKGGTEIVMTQNFVQ